MTKVFADTSYWIAILVPKDGLHEKAIRCSNELAKPVQIITTEMVLTELLNALANYGASLRAAATDLVQKLRRRTDTMIINQTHSQFEDALGVYQSYNDKEWSLTDCASYKVMRERELNIALTEDHHFEQMRFRALLR